MLAESGLPMSFFEKSSVQKWLKSLSEILGNPEIANIGTSARTIGRYQDSVEVEFKNMVRACGHKLAKKGRISLQADHFHSRRASGEESRLFLGVILCCRDSQYSLRKIPLCFKPARDHSFAEFRKDLVDILSVSAVLKSFILTDLWHITGLSQYLKSFFGSASRTKDFSGPDVVERIFSARLF